VKERDIQRILEYRLSPLYVSVHATPWEARKVLLNNPRVPNIVEQLSRLAEGGIRFHCQMVVVPGLNDGAVLEESLQDLWNLGDAVLSAAIVPVGLTQFSHLYSGKSMDAVLNEASGMLSGLTHSAGVVLTAKSNVRIKHIEFVRLEPERALVVLVAEDGQVENRVIELPAGLPSSALNEASNFLNAHVRGRTLLEAKIEMEKALETQQRQLDALTQKIIAAGLASWSGGESDERKLIVRGAAHLLEDLKAVEDLERVRLLFDELETKRGVIDLLGRAEHADGARIYIGSENKLFSLSGSSTIVAPYRDQAGRIVGVLGVIGPTRLNYARVIPMVDYTAKVVSKIIGG